MDHFKELVNVLYNHHCIENKKAPVLILSCIYIQIHLCVYTVHTHTRRHIKVLTILKYFWKFLTDLCIFSLPLAAHCRCCEMSKFPIPTTNCRTQLFKFQNHMIDDDESALHALHYLLESKVRNDSPISSVLCVKHRSSAYNHSLLFSARWISHSGWVWLPNITFYQNVNTHILWLCDTSIFSKLATTAAIVFSFLWKSYRMHFGSHIHLLRYCSSEW